MSTNAWDESRPAGSEFLNTGDDSIRQLKVDLRERLAVSLLWNTGNEGAQVESGVVTNGGVSSLQDGIKNWGSNVWKGGYVVITAGVGIGQVREVISNTSDTIIVDRAWTTALDGTSFYKVENYDVGTLKVGSARMLFGLDADKPTSAIQGQIYFGTDTLAVYVWDGVQWIVIASRDLYNRTVNSQPADLVISGDGGVADQTVFTFMLPGGMIGVDGSIHLEMEFMEAGGGSNTFRISYGATTLSLSNVGSVAKSFFRAHVYSKGVNAQYISAQYQRDGGGLVQGGVDASEDSTVDQLFVITCRRSGGVGSTTTRKAAVLTRT